MQGLSRKQVVYAGIFIGVAALFVFAVAVYFFSSAQPEPTCVDGLQNQEEQGVDCGGPCTVLCKIKNLSPITLSRYNIFFLDGDRTSLLLVIQNPNKEYGARQFSYTVRYYGIDGAELTATYGDSFIYAGEIKYIFVPVLNFSPTELDRIEFSVGEPRWASVADFYRPTFSIVNKETFLEDGMVRVKGMLQNANRVPFSRVELIAFFRDAEGIIIGASQTYLEDVDSGDTRQFSIIHPPLFKLDPAKTEVVASALRSW